MFRSLATRCHVCFVRRRPAGEGGAEATWSWASTLNCSPGSKLCRKGEGSEAWHQKGERGGMEKQPSLEGI